MHDRAKRKKNLLIMKLQDGAFGPTTQFTYHTDLFYTESDSPVTQCAPDRGCATASDRAHETRSHTRTDHTARDRARHHDRSTQ